MAKYIEKAVGGICDSCGCNRQTTFKDSGETGAGCILAIQCNQEGRVISYGEVNPTCDTSLISDSCPNGFRQHHKLLITGEIDFRNQK